MNQPEFLPTTRREMDALGWEELDVLLVSGDAYVDSHAFGVSLLGRWLVEHGFRTGIVAQPGWESDADISVMGRPRLFAGISAGSVDSLLAHYTAFRKKRSSDAYSPGGKASLRPNRASIVYTGLVKTAFPGLPVVLGGIEASLRRASHYDFWSNSLRRSILLDSKADAILYGMGERSILELARALAGPASDERPADRIARLRIRGTAYAIHPDRVLPGTVELPSHEAIEAENRLLIKATMAFERQMAEREPCLMQRSAGRAVVFEKPSEPLTVEEMDQVYGLPFTRKAHPSYSEPIPAVAMLEGSITSHRGCGGGCSFCSLASHQGRQVQSRSAGSILDEVTRMTKDANWKGSITDIGGPSSNMWKAVCVRDQKQGCGRDSCLFPKRCRYFRNAPMEQMALFSRVLEIDGVNHLRVASGVRHDLALESEGYMRELVEKYTGGQLKIAPEHVADKVLWLMRKPTAAVWEKFLKRFATLSKEAGKEQYIVPYLISAFPGATDDDMLALAAWLQRKGWKPQQVQCFIPTPGTVATAMFFAGFDTEGREISVARSDAARLRQHRILMPQEGDATRRSGGKPGDAQTDRSFTPGGKRPFRSGQGRGDKRPFRSSEGGGERRSASPSGRPYSSGGDKRPFRSGEGRGDKRPFRSSEGGGDRRSASPAGRPYSSGGGERPFRSGEGRGEKRPFRSSEGGGERRSASPSGRPYSSGGDKRPFRSGEGRGEKRPFRSSEGGGERRSASPSGRPYSSGGDKRPFRSGEGRGDKRPFRSSESGGERRSASPSGRPYSSGGDKRPFRSGEGRGDKRPFRSSEGGGERPFRSSDRPGQNRTGGPGGRNERKTGPNRFGKPPARNPRKNKDGGGSGRPYRRDKS